MSDIPEYKIISVSSLNAVPNFGELERTVAEMLRQRWELLGGVAVGCAGQGAGEGFSVCAQAMVRRRP
jgi:hypothetical protein